MDKDGLDATLWQLIEERPMTFGELYPHANRLFGEIGQHGRGYRATDAWLQRNRRAGKIAFKREGRKSLWYPLPHQAPAHER